MYSKIFLFALASATVVSAHGKIAVATGDAGGNTTALGIQGAAVPGTGPNGKTETDTTIFDSVDAMTDGLGKTEGQGKNTLDMMTDVVAQSGSTLPQVSASGGTISGTMHIVTTDGAGPFTAVVDSTGQGAFGSGTKAEVTTQVPGKNGNTAPGPLKNNLLRRAMWHLGISKRALNVDSDYPFDIAVPAGMSCTGTVGDMQNVCLMKIANPSKAGPFGGVIAFQMASANSSSTSTASSASASTTAAARSLAARAGGEAAGAEGKTAKRSAKFVQF
ncbi:hypothetical protein BD289DRAFT_456641 [Coniella lustricola]|uniref:Cell surface protein n=1 Tax=Coniella lustricola TaxID=2025994 RepID=A0A2T2ZV49_9PEZI|nr:hypothetical protein BD289DRAFT_456641 [Coniella lustricola]